ncbi:membrane protein [Rugosimonospora africana]|uniref:Membrane protein n=1 Tax=Rugosimonospora africana TaxID=556532 RepID=A0A8J3R2L8_9ACTN|nr:membrane protein [Rugosimonospora africana]
MTVREGLRGLTTRGKSFLACAVAMAVLSVVFGEKDLLRVALLIAALPLLGAWYVGRTRYKLACTRTLDPHRTPVGATARVVLRLQNLSGLPTGTLLLEDRLPYALGSRPRLVLERLGRHQASSVAYTVRADVRGRYEVGPLVVRLTDPFGLCELTRSFPSIDRLTVIPQVTALPSVRLAGEYAGTGESRARSVAVHGEDDAATREYRHGDDLRRVHWRSTARVGELMVRREEQPWESRATLVLDTRTLAHRGEGPTASFEWAVSAIASIAMHLRHGGYRLRLVTDAGVDIDATEAEGDGAILDHLAEVKLSPNSEVTNLIDMVRHRADGGMIISVLGMLSPTEAELLGALRTSNATCVGFLIDSTTWLNLPTAAREEADQTQGAAALSLLRTGWRVVGVRHGDKLPGLWPQAARGSQGFAWRAAMAETVTTTTGSGAVGRPGT